MTNKNFDNLSEEELMNILNVVSKVEAVEDLF